MGSSDYVECLRHIHKVDQRLDRIQQIRSYYAGMRAGITRYATWHDGIQYVGAGFHTLAYAIREIDKEERDKINRLE